jgi:hypothetical protein
MNTTDNLVADVEADIFATEGAFHVHGIYYAIFGDADLAHRRLAIRTADTVARVRAWTRRGALVDGLAIRPAIGSVPKLFERCTWCGKRFEPGAPAIVVATRHIHERTCREEFDRFLAEAEIARAQATLQMAEV